MSSIRVHLRASVTVDFKSIRLTGAGLRNLSRFDLDLHQIPPLPPPPVLTAECAGNK
jgi:hypothetical protein